MSRFGIEKKFFNHCIWWYRVKKHFIFPPDFFLFRFFVSSQVSNEFHSCTTDRKMNFTSSLRNLKFFGNMHTEFSSSQKKGFFKNCFQKQLHLRKSTIKMCFFEFLSTFVAKIIHFFRFKKRPLFCAKKKQTNQWLFTFQKLFGVQAVVQRRLKNMFRKQKTLEK